MVLYTVGLLNTAVYRPAVLVFRMLSSWYKLLHLIQMFAILCKSLHVDEISSKSSAYIKTLNINVRNMTTMSSARKFTYMWQREAVRAQQIIRTVGFLQKLFAIDDVTKYRGIPVSRYFLRRYITVGHFLIPRIPRYNFTTGGFQCCMGNWDNRIKLSE